MDLFFLALDPNRISWVFLLLYFLFFLTMNEWQLQLRRWLDSKEDFDNRLIVFFGHLSSKKSQNILLVSSVLICENLLLLLVIYDCKWRVFRFFWLSVWQKEAFSRRQFWHFIDLTINQWWKYSRSVAARTTSPLALLHMLCGSLLICDVLLVECAHRWFVLFLTLQWLGQEGYIFVFSAQKKKKKNEGTGSSVCFDDMFSWFDPRRRKRLVRLGIVRCDKLHTYALFRDGRDSRVFFFFRCTKSDPCRSGEEHCTPSNLPYTSFVPFLLHVMLFRFSIYIFLKTTLVVSSIRSFYFSVSIHNCLFKGGGVSYHNVR